MEARSPGALAPVIWAAAGAALAVAGVALGAASLAMVGVFPLVLAALLSLGRTSGVQFTLEDNGMRVLRDGTWIPYDSIRKITVRNLPWNGGPPAAPIVIEHAAGRLFVPPGLSVPPDDLYAWLSARVPPQPPPVCPPELADYHAAQVAKFGADKVELIVRRPASPSLGLGVAGQLALACLLTAIAWGVLAAVGRDWFHDADERDAWGIAALSVGLITFVVALIMVAVSSGRKSHLKKAGRAAIIVGPAGLAMKQADMKGQLRWEEILGVTPAAGGSQLRIAVRGARIVVLDVYDRSLADVAAAIRRNLG